MFADLPLMLHLAFGMVAAFDGLIALVLLLALPYLGYLTWLTRYGQRVEGTLTNVIHKPQTKRGPMMTCYEVTWTDPRTQEARRALLKYPATFERSRKRGEAVPVYVHPTCSRLRTVRLWEDSWQLGQAWKEGALLSYLAEVLFRAVRWGIIGTAWCLIPALVNILLNFQNWQLGLGFLLGGFLAGFIGAWIGGLFLRR
jgi:hypothetical protein